MLAKAAFILNSHFTNFQYHMSFQKPLEYEDLFFIMANAENSYAANC